MLAKRIVSHDFGDDLLLEYDLFTRVMQSKLLVGQSFAANLVRDLREWITQLIETSLRPAIAKARDSNLAFREPELVPPGECIHIYRDGTAWQGSYVSCTFFDELDIAWHAVEDHLIPVSTAPDSFGASFDTISPLVFNRACCCITIRLDITLVFLTLSAARNKT